MKLRPVAVIDIGSNTIRSLIVEILPDGNYRVLDDEREVARLASGLSRRRRLSRDAIQRALGSLKRMAEIIRARGVRKIAVVATSAIRDAANRQVFLDRVRAETGLRVRVVSGVEEARLAFESAARSFDLGGRSWAVADVGGGSTEVILALGNHIRGVYSLTLGAVALTEEFLQSDPVKGRELKALRREIRGRLEAAEVDLEPGPQILITSGGTATAAAQVTLARQGLSGKPVHGFEMTQAELLHLQQALQRRSLRERRQMPGLSPDRADILLAGVTILYEIMDHLKVNTLRVSTRGIRHALLNRLIARKPAHVAVGFGKRSRLAAAQALGRSLRFEQDHGEQVSRLTLSLFDQLQVPLGLDPGSRDLLAAAALLHDVGYVVSYRQHHKHSYHLISHAHLDGFTSREREIVALVARYHRRASPRKKHPEWAALPRHDRDLVLRLTAMLRIADALDRRHSRGVREIRCRVEASRVILNLVAPRDLSVEIHGAVDKAGLFRKVFHLDVVFRSLRLATQEKAARAHRSASPPGPKG